MHLISRNYAIHKKSVHGGGCVVTERERENKCVGAIAEAVDTSIVPLDASGCQVSALASGRDKPPRSTLLPLRLGLFAVFQAFVHHHQHGLRALACYLVTYKHKLQSGCFFFFPEEVTTVDSTPNVTLLSHNYGQQQTCRAPCFTHSTWCTSLAACKQRLYKHDASETGK